MTSEQHRFRCVFVGLSLCFHIAFALLLCCFRLYSVLLSLRLCTTLRVNEQAKSKQTAKGQETDSKQRTNRQQANSKQTTSRQQTNGRQSANRQRANCKERANRQLSCCFFALALAFGLLSLGFLRTLSVLFANPGSIAVGSLWAPLFAPFRSLSLSFAPFWPPFAPFWSPLALFWPPLVNFCLRSLPFRTLFRPLWLS